MFEIGDYVVNSTNGICRIREVVEMEASQAKKSYFLLVPIEEENAKVFIPVENAPMRIRKVISKEDALAVIDDIPNVKQIVVENEKEREQKYKEAVYSCNPTQLVSLIKCLRIRKEERTACGKKITAVDERFTKIAENNLTMELAFAIGIEKKNVIEFVENRLNGVES